MHQQRALAILGLAGAAVLATASCSRPDAIWTDDDGLLKYVPADTPYLFAVLEPAPDEFMDKMRPTATAMVDSYRQFIDVIVNQAISDAALEIPDEAQLRIRAVADAVAGMITEEGRSNAGIDADALGVFYGRGLLPVLRLTLADASRFEAAIASIEAAAGSALPVARLGEQSYRYFENEAVRVVIAVQDDQLIVTAAPVGLSDAHLTSVLENELPAESIAESGKLEDFADDYGFEPFQVGFLDIELLAATFLEPQSGVNAELLGLAGYDAAAMLSEVCRAEFRELANVVPRMVFGSMAFDDDRIQMKGVVELRPDIAAGLESVAAAVPGLGTSSDGLFAIGMGFDVAAARDFALARLAAIESDPFRCEFLRDMQQDLPAARQSLNTPLPPYVEDIHGFVAILDDIAGMNLAANQPPTNIDARVLLASDSAATLLALAAGFVPEIAALNLEPNGTPVRVAIPPVIGPTLTEAYVALTDRFVAVAIGRDAETRLRALVAAPASEPLFMVSDIDMGRYYELLDDAMSIAASQDPSIPSELSSAMDDLLAPLADAPFARSRGELSFTEHGVEFMSTLTLRD